MAQPGVRSTNEEYTALPSKAFSNFQAVRIGDIVTKFAFVETDKTSNKCCQIQGDDRRTFLNGVLLILNDKMTNEE